MVCGMLRSASSKGHMQREGGCAVVRRGHLTAVVGTFLIGCAVLLLGLGCAGTSSETSKKAQEPTEAIQKEQTRSPEATASEEARCQGTRPFQQQGVHLTTNDLPECPKGGPLLISSSKRGIGGTTSSIAVKARTNTPLTRTTSCRAAARRRPSRSLPVPAERVGPGAWRT